MPKINCHWYSNDEIADALRKKGYIIVYDTETDRRGNEVNIWMAIKDGKTHDLETAALKEFQKKPPLI